MRHELGNEQTTTLPAARCNGSRFSFGSSGCGRGRPPGLRGRLHGGRRRARPSGRPRPHPCSGQHDWPVEAPAPAVAKCAEPKDGPIDPPEPAVDADAPDGGVETRVLPKEQVVRTPVPVYVDWPAGGVLKAAVLHYRP